MGRYLSGLCAAGLGLCGGGWLIVTAVLLGGAPSDAALVTLATGAGVALVSVVALGCWSVAWRQRMRDDGVLRAESRAPSPRQARRSRRALRREMRRAAKNRARRGSRPEAQPSSGRPARSARPDTGITGLGLTGTSIAHLVPEPRIPVALHPRGGDPPVGPPEKGGRPPFHPPPQGDEHTPLAPGPPGSRAGGDPLDPPAATARGGDPPVDPPEKGGRPPLHPPPQGRPAQTAGSLGLPSQTCPEEALAGPGSPSPVGTSPPPTAAEAATLVAELRAILEPLLAASGEGEEAW